MESRRFIYENRRFNIAFPPKSIERFAFAFGLSILNIRTGNFEQIRNQQGNSHSNCYQFFKSQVTNM